MITFKSYHENRNNRDKYGGCSAYVNNKNVFDVQMREEINGIGVLLTDNNGVTYIFMVDDFLEMVSTLKKSQGIE